MSYSIKKIGHATATQAGLMSAADKAKLDSGLSFHPTRLPNAFTLFYYSFGGYEDEPEVLPDDMLQYLDGLTPALLHECLASGRRLRFGLDEVLDPDGTATEQQKLLASFPVKVDVCTEDENVGGTKATCFFLTLDTPLLGLILCAMVYFANDGGQLLKAEGFRAFRTLDKDQFRRATTLFSASSMGLCPQAPSADASARFLRGDGTWAAPDIPGVTTGTAIPETLKVLAPGELPWIEEGSADFDPTRLFPFSGKPERWVLQGAAPVYRGDTAGYPCTGTFEYGVDESRGAVVAVLSYTAALSASSSVRRTRTAEFTYDAGGGIDGIRWIPFGWLKPGEV